MARPAPPLALLALALILLGCAGEEGRRSTRSGDRARWSAAAAGPDVDLRGDAPDASAHDGLADRGSRTVFVERFQTIAIAAAPPAAEPRPRRRRSVDLDLQGAAFDDVARMLSEVGGFPLVVEAPNAGVVHASLRGVDAWDALSAIAHAKGLDVTWSGGIAIVGAR